MDNKWLTIETEGHGLKKDVPTRGWRRTPAECVAQ